MISKLFYSLVFIKLLQISALADAKIYTVFVCSDKTYEQAFSDKNHYIKYPKADTFIIRSKAGPYRVAYGKFKHIGDAEVFRKTLPEELKKLNPYVEKLTEEYLAQTKQGKVTTFPFACVPIDPIQNDKPQVTSEISEDVQDNDKNTTKEIISVATYDIKNYDPKNLDRIVIYINSIKNYMSVRGYINDQEFRFKTYKVSTAKVNTKKPQGAGHISSIVLRPIWYPTVETRDYFKNVRKILLAKAITPESPYNYMGAAKILLTHKVDGRQTYRIHGTINEKTIGRHESAGCIRMKNNEVLTLARFLNKFSSYKGIKNILVVLD